MSKKYIGGVVTAEMDYEPPVKELEAYIPPDVLIEIKAREDELILFGYSFGDIYGYMLPKERVGNANIWYNRQGLVHSMMSNNVHIVEIRDECVLLSDGLCYYKKSATK